MAKYFVAVKELDDVRLVKFNTAQELLDELLGDSKLGVFITIKVFEFDEIDGLGPKPVDISDGM